MRELILDRLEVEVQKVSSGVQVSEESGTYRVIWHGSEVYFSVQKAEHRYRVMIKNEVGFFGDDRIQLKGQYNVRRLWNAVKEALRGFEYTDGDVHFPGFFVTEEDRFFAGMLRGAFPELEVRIEHGGFTLNKGTTSAGVFREGVRGLPGYHPKERAFLWNEGNMMRSEDCKRWGAVLDRLEIMGVNI